MVRDSKSGALHPADMATFQSYVPELFAGEIEVDMLPFEPLIDSSNVNPENWSRMAHMVYDNYEKYDGFVILHGTDTMSYSASALSFMLHNLAKPVVFTGSQLPVGVLRSDAKENLLTAIEIAAAKDENGRAMVPEVTIFMDDELYRGNRTTKRNAEHFSAFNSYNYPALARAGVRITYQKQFIAVFQNCMTVRDKELTLPFYHHNHNAVGKADFPHGFMLFQKSFVGFKFRRYGNIFRHFHGKIFGIFRFAYKAQKARGIRYRRPLHNQ